MKTKNSKRKTVSANAGCVRRLVSLRRWLENNLKYMEDARKRASRRNGWKRYWREGARKIKTHLTTVKMIERAAQANDGTQRREKNL